MAQGFFLCVGNGQMSVARMWGIALPNLAFPWEFGGFGYGLGSLAFECADAWFDALAPDYGNKKGIIWKISNYENV